MAQLVNLRRVGVPLRAAEGQGRRSPRSARGTSMPIYDEMSPTERKKLMDGLEALTGLQEGPKNALPDGTRYEYDPMENCGSHTGMRAIRGDVGRWQTAARFPNGG
jgi:hypothetical protein